MRGTPHRPWSWLADLPRRAGLEAAARSAYPSLTHRRRQRPDGPVHIYAADVPVPGYASRHVVIEFNERYPSSPTIYADGPAGGQPSPHRYPGRGSRQLCVWHPSDPDDRRWVPDDGLLTLFGMVAQHLLKEAWWRETGEWPGEEYPHGELTAVDPPPAGRLRR